MRDFKTLVLGDGKALLLELLLQLFTLDLGEVTLIPQLVEDLVVLPFSVPTTTECCEESQCCS